MLFLYVQAAAIFNPGKMTICLTVAANGAPVPLLAAPAGYTVAGSSLQSLAGGDTVMVHSLLAQPHAPIAIKEVCRCTAPKVVSL